MRQTNNGVKVKNFTRMRNGEAVLKDGKPVQYYKPLRTYSNNWYFADLSRSICEQVWEIGQNYYRLSKEGKIKNAFSHPVELTKYFYFLYLTGARLMEPALEPPPTLEFKHEDGGTQVVITRRNEKHIQPNGRPDEIAAEIPIFDEAEKNMWMFITDGGITMNTREIFRLEQWGSLKKDNLSHLIKHNFRTNLRDPMKKMHKDNGIPAHVLRHMRTYNVILPHKVPADLAINWFGWRDTRMVYYYAHIRDMLTLRNQHTVLKNNGLLTNIIIKPSALLMQG